MARPGFIDQLFEGFARAIADIREKVVEEPWFGRAVTADPPGVNMTMAQAEAEAPLDRAPRDGAASLEEPAGLGHALTDPLSRENVLRFMAAGFTPDKGVEHEIDRGLDR